MGVGSHDALTMHDGDLELGVCSGLRLFIEEIKGVMVILLHDVHVFLVELRTRKATELVILGLVIGIKAGRRGESPGLGKRLHLRSQGVVFHNHLVREGLNLRIGGLGLRQFAELDLVETALRDLGEELLVQVGDRRVRRYGDQASGANERCGTNQFRDSVHGVPSSNAAMPRVTNGYEV